MEIDRIHKNLELFIDTYNSKILIENVNISRVHLSLDDNSINLNIDYQDAQYADMLKFNVNGNIYRVESWQDPEVLLMVKFGKPEKVGTYKEDENDFGWEKIYKLIKTCANSERTVDENYDRLKA